VGTQRGGERKQNRTRFTTNGKRKRAGKSTAADILIISKRIRRQSSDGTITNQGRLSLGQTSHRTIDEGDLVMPISLFSARKDARS